jgi:hypothetical protein
MVYIGEELDIKSRLIGLGLSSSEKQIFTLVGIISNMPISNTYDPTHNPCNATPSCPMSSLKMVSPGLLDYP